MILLVIVVVAAAVMKAVAELILAYAGHAGEIGDIAAASRS